MKFSYYDLGHLNKGQVVEVCLSAAANVISGNYFSLSEVTFDNAFA